MYFYKAGDEFWNIWKSGHKPAGSGIQTVASELGFGKSTGIELGDAAGRIPDPGVAGRVREGELQEPQDADQPELDLVSRATTCTPRSARATTSSRRCSSRTRTRRSRTATRHTSARCGRRTSARSVTDPVTKKTVSQLSRRRRGARSTSIRAYGRRSRPASRAWSPIRRGTAYDAFQGLAIPVVGQDGNRRDREPGRDADRVDVVVRVVLPGRQPAVRGRGGRRTGRARRADRGADRAPGHRVDHTADVTADPDPDRTRRARTDGHASPRPAGRRARRPTRACSRTSTSRCSRCRSRSARSGC